MSKNSLHSAIRERDNILVYIMLQFSKESSEVRDRKGNTALLKAVKIKNEEAAMLCVAYGGNIKAKNKRRNNVLHYAAKLNLSLNLLCLLLDRGADVNAKNANGRTPLYYALQEGNLKAVRFLLKKGATFNNISKDYTAVQIAAARGDTAMLKLLYEYDADLNSSELGMESTVLHLAVAGGHAETVEFLLAKGAAINKEDKYGNTPLITATVHGKEELVEILLQNGAKRNHTNNYGWSSIDYARGNEKILAILNNAEVDESSRDYYIPDNTPRATGVNLYR